MSLRKGVINEEQWRSKRRECRNFLENKKRSKGKE